MAAAKKAFGAFKKNPQQLKSVQRVSDWTRERFSLGEELAVMVTEVACQLPGCPPLETVIAFWSDEKTRHDFKIFKPVAEIIEDDLPPAWLKDSLISDDDPNCECC
jgi:nitrate reductase delta subunit